MARIAQLLRRLVPLALVFAATLTTAAPVAGQVAEAEPNNTCETAQDIGSTTLPFAMSGSLDTTPASGDVDFFRFTGIPSATVQVDLEGQATAAGTLPDPLVGVFSSSCAPLTSDDNSGTPPNARALVSVPSDGILVVAATSCCDYSFVGAGFSSGSYALKLSKVASAASIGGRVIDATSGQPLPFAFVELHRCTNGDCFQAIAGLTTDDQGRFLFENGPLLPLLAGTYVLFVSDGPTYQPAQTQPFDVAEAQKYDAGDIGLELVPVAGAISGRVVDAITGLPVRGNGPPFALVHLQQCDPFFGCFDMAVQPTDAQGHFRFAADTTGFPLPVGAYQLLITADQYMDRVVGPFNADANKDVDLGDIAFTPYIIRVSEIRPCGNLPPEGGPCEYSFRITNGLSTTLSGLAWTVVESSGTEAISQTTRFQPGLPTWYILEPGASRVVRFDFDVPGGLPNGTTICVQGLASRGSTFFDVVGRRNLFCITKGNTGFRLLPEKEAQARLRQAPHAAVRGAPAARHK